MSWLSWWHLIIAGVAGLLFISVALAMALGIYKSASSVVWLIPQACGWLWSKLTGRALTSHGSARLSTPDEVEKAGLFSPGSLALGTLNGRTVYAPAGSHVALVAPPRSGKSWGLVMPNIRSWEGSIIINDLRGELYEETQVERQAKGPVYRFAPTSKDSIAINVCDLVRWGQVEAHGDVGRLVHGLMSPGPGEVQSHFSIEAEPLLAGILHDRYAAGDASLPSAARWMTDPGASLKDKAKALLTSPLPVVSATGRRLLDKSDNEMSAVWSSALAALSIYSDPLIAANTSDSDLDVADLQDGTRPISIYLCPGFSDVSRLRPLLATLTEMMLARVSAPRTMPPRHRVLLCLDEGANLGRLHELERGVSYLQGAGVSLLAVFQNLQQVEHVYGPRTPLMASISTAVFYTPLKTDVLTSETLSTMLGTGTALQIATAHGLERWRLFEQPTAGDRRHGRPVMTPDEIANMGADEALMFVPGVRPVRGRKLGAAPEVNPVSHRFLKPAVAAGLMAIAITTFLLFGRHDTPAPPVPPVAVTLPPLPIPEPTAPPLPSTVYPSLPAAPPLSKPLPTATSMSRMVLVDTRDGSRSEPMPWSECMTLHGERTRSVGAQTWSEITAASLRWQCRYAE